MNHTLRKVSAFSALTFFLLASFTLPVIAQSTTTTDGSNDSTTERRQYIRGWRGQSNGMQQQISALGSSITVSVPIPVLFGVELGNLSSDFGDARSNGRTHIGNDIMAVKGTPIVSPTPAVVLRTGVGSGEGIYVYTANPGGETFVYMHLDKLGEGITSGTILEKGSLIGYVGNTGNASGGAAHLHFEIHDSNGTPIDPHPRTTATLSLQEKIQYLSKILTQTSDANALAQLLVVNFRSTFTQALAAGITLPQVITSFMSSIPAGTTPSPSANTLPVGDLALGSKGNDVVRLQLYLIAKNTGPYAIRLAQASATGNFGAMTQSALIEYQASVGISPADGYYGVVTRAKVEANPINSLPTNPTPTSPTTPSITTITRNLTLNAVGEDVRTLQKFLNARGYTVATTGSGSLGNETTFFGPATRAAVVRFQLAQSISPAAGYVGPLTRAKLAALGI